MRPRTENERIYLALIEMRHAQRFLLGSVRWSADYLAEQQRRLPEDVQRRLTLLRPQIIKRLLRLSETQHAPEIVEDLASAEAVAQVERAIAFYEQQRDWD